MSFLKNTGNLDYPKRFKKKKSNYCMLSKRIQLKKGKQKELIEKAKNKNKLTWHELSTLLNLSELYVCNELRHETRLLGAEEFEKLCKLVDKDYTVFIKDILDSNWGQVKGGANSNAGGQGLVKIKNPQMTPRFAELIGAYLGDGTLTKYFMRITADKRYSFPYLEYLSKIAEEALGIKTTIRIPSTRNIAYLEIRSKQFCDYFKENLGISFGDKIRNKVKIPKEILKNKNLARACLRGLMDTDGSFSKRGTYMCLEFTSFNPILLEQVCQLGKQFEVFTHKNKEQVGTNSWPKIMRYFNLIGSSNRIHIVRFSERLYNKKLLYKTDLFQYFKKYDGIKLPYMGP